jgi:hypothetical protein
MFSFYKICLVDEVYHVNGNEMHVLRTLNLHSPQHHYVLCVVSCDFVCAMLLWLRVFNSGLTVSFFVLFLFL